MPITLPQVCCPTRLLARNSSNSELSLVLHKQVGGESGTVIACSHSKIPPFWFRYIAKNQNLMQVGLLNNLAEIRKVDYHFDF